MNSSRTSALKLRTTAVSAVAITRWSPCPQMTVPFLLGHELLFHQTWSILEASSGFSKSVNKPAILSSTLSGSRKASCLYLHYMSEESEA